MSHNIQFILPSECIPAIIGLNGDKVKDTKSVTGTTIQLTKKSDLFHLVSVSGHSIESCHLAKRILLHAVSHHLASLQEPLHVPNGSGQAEAGSDVHTFFTETYNRQSRGKTLAYY